MGGRWHTCLGSATDVASEEVCARDASAACSTVSRMGPSWGRQRGPSADTHSAIATTALLRTAACSSCNLTQPVSTLSWSLSQGYIKLHRRCKELASRDKAMLSSDGR